GYTPWGTYLTTEENFNQYIARKKEGDAGDIRDAMTEHAISRYKVNNKASGYNWQSITAPTLSSVDMFSRWNTAALANTAQEDYLVSLAIDVKRVAFYMGDDSQGEYIYKFVSATNWNPSDINGGYAAGDKYMDKGKFYVAKFDFNEATGEARGEWLELSMNNPKITSYDKYQFKDQADILVHARLAADAAGATKMDRPEWVAVNPENGEVYVTLTNHSQRGTGHAIDAANPRQYTDDDDATNRLSGNINGHIIRFRETGDDVTATSFTWDIFLFGAEADSIPGVNLSGLTDANDFSSPDGMWFDDRGVLWLQTDDGAYTDTTNCMMLAALPGSVSD